MVRSNSSYTFQIRRKILKEDAFTFVVDLLASTDLRNNLDPTRPNNIRPVEFVALTKRRNHLSFNLHDIIYHTRYRTTQLEVTLKS